MKTLKDLFADTIRDIYDSERQVSKALPDLAEASESQRLTSALKLHIRQTAEHLRRIEAIASQIGFDPAGEHCPGTQGLVREAREHLYRYKESMALDAAIIACTQKIEHYEIANYCSAIAFAEQLGYEAAASILEQTLQEEVETEEILNDIAEGEVNIKATDRQHIAISLF